MDLMSVVIESERLRLVPTDEPYASQIFREFTNEITELMGPKTPGTLEEVLTYIKRTRTNISNGEEIQVLVLLKDTGEFIGHGGVHMIKTPMPELGIWIKKAAHGHKYGREAVTALAGWAFENLEFVCLTYPVDRRNIPSRRIPEALGALIEREYEWTNESGKLLDILEYRIYPSSLGALQSELHELYS